MTKEKILNIIKKCSTLDIDGNAKYVDVLEYDMLANKLLEALIIDGVINWVACDKKLPKQTGAVLIYVDGLGVRNAIFNITDNSFSFNSVYKPTHWAELPKPPCL